LSQTQSCFRDVIVTKIAVTILIIRNMRVTLRNIPGKWQNSQFQVTVIK